MSNLILDTDSYKASHFLQYPGGTEHVSSYIESRGIDEKSMMPEGAEVVHFGLQPFLQGIEGHRITKHDVEEAKELFEAHGEPFHYDGWMRIVNMFGGKLPVVIEALPEGMVVPTGTMQVQIRNTDPESFWITSYLETALLRAVWYPSTVATLSREVKKIIFEYLDQTDVDPDTKVMFKLHDFGSRGVSSRESSILGGMAHLVNFLGTDTVGGIVGARKYYDEPMAGFSIPAAEHSTITAWEKHNEVFAFSNMLTKFGGKDKMVAVVSDSYNIFHACEKLWGERLKDKVEEMGGTLIVRPDSGDPVTVVQKCLDILGEKFGTDTNQKGYKVLKPCVRVIQGDGVNPDSIRDILRFIRLNGWSADNVAFGMGGALLQKLDRDTLKYAMKANAIRVHEKWKDVYKQPITDKEKDSKRGRLATIRDFTGEIRTVRAEEARDEVLTVPVFNNGRVLKTWTFDEVRENAKLKG